MSPESTLLIILPVQFSVAVGQTVDASIDHSLNFFSRDSYLSFCRVTPVWEVYRSDAPATGFVFILKWKMNFLTAPWPHTQNFMVMEDITRLRS